MARLPIFRGSLSSPHCLLSPSMWAPTPNHTCFHAPLPSPSSHFQKKTLPSPAPGRQRSHLEGTCSPTHTCTCLKPEASTWRARVCPHTGSSLSPSWDPPPAPPGRASFSECLRSFTPSPLAFPSPSRNALRIHAHSVLHLSKCSESPCVRTQVPWPHRCSRVRRGQWV